MLTNMGGGGGGGGSAVCAIAECRHSVYDEHMDVYCFMWIPCIICTSTRLHVEGISM